MTSRLHPPTSPESLPARIAAGTRAILAAQVASQLFALAVLAGMWRLVGPADYGLLGMVMPWVMLIRMVSSGGLGVAAIQHAELNSRQLTSLFWWQLGLGGAAGVATAAFAPLAAALYQTPSAAQVMLALAGIAPLAAGGILHDALLQRKLLIGQLMGVRLAAQATGAACGISAALTGLGVGALVIQQYGEMLTLTVGLWYLESWRPASFSRGESIGPLLRFGGYYTFSGLLFYAAQNLDKVLLALLLGTSEPGRVVVGLYTQAFGLMMRPVAFVTTPLTGLMLPALAAATRDRRQFENIAVRFYRLTAIILWPSAVGLFVVAPELTTLLGGAEWKSAGIFLQIFAIAIAAQGAINISGSVFAAAGRADSLLGGALVMLLVLAQAYGAGYFFAGLADASTVPLVRGAGVALGFTVATSVILFVPYLLYLCAVTQLSPRRLLMATLKPALPAAIMGVAVWALQTWLKGDESIPLPARLAVAIVAGVVLYLVLARHEVKWLWRELRA